MKPLGTRDFVNAMNKNRLEALEDLNEYDPLLNAVMTLAGKNKNYAFVFNGSPTELYKQLIELTPGKYHKSGLPDSPATLSKKLNGLKPVLREMGIEISEKKSGDKRVTSQSRGNLGESAWRKQHSM